MSFDDVLIRTAVLVEIIIAGIGFPSHTKDHNNIYQQVLV